MNTRPSRVNDTFRNALVVEVRDFLAEDEILQQHGAAWMRLERILIIRNRQALIRRKRRMFFTCDLMEFAAGG